MSSPGKNKEDVKKKLKSLHLNVLQAMCTRKHLGISAKSDKKGKGQAKLNLPKEALIEEILKKPIDKIWGVIDIFQQDGEEKFLQDASDESEPETTENKELTKKQLLDKLARLEGQLKDEKEEITREEKVTNKSMKEYMKTLVDKTTENEEKAKAKAPPTPTATPASTPAATPPSTTPPTPKNSPTKTDNTRDYKQVKFQGLTKDENSNAKVQVKMARVQITKSDIEKELEKQNNRRFGFQHNKISYNTHWGKQGGKISSELI